MQFIVPAGMAAPFQGKKIEGKKIKWLFAPDPLPWGPVELTKP
jgi:hypothetical protein